MQATALLGFNALTRCDQTGRFNGKTKILGGKQLYYAGEDVLAAVAESVVDINILLSWYIIH